MTEIEVKAQGLDCAGKFRCWGQEKDGGDGGLGERVLNKKALNTELSSGFF